MKKAIIVIAYNRPHSLRRILSKLQSCDYSESVDLIVSIDRSEVREELIEIAKEIEWSSGQIKVIAHSKRLGLRNHVLSCGDLVRDYEAIIMLEDDIVPSKYFYKYVSEAIKFYKKDKNIGGISLYAPTSNEMVEKPFNPLETGYDAFFLKSASSWGQCWTREMWFDFREWYNENSTPLEVQSDLPDKIYSWPDTSWKKYYMKYLVLKNKYFVYPYVSLTTNLSEVGQHVKQENSMYQVPLLMGEKEYNFPSFHEGLKYDAFFENENIKQFDIFNNLEKKIDLLCVDIYGSKRNFSQYKYLLTSKKYNYKIVKTYGLSYKPHELNLIYNHNGNILFLYDLSKKEKNTKLENNDKQIVQYYSSINWKDALKLATKGINDTLKKKLKIKY